ncbi:MAG: 3,4-dehydroadipyl-CoA semialdehyde dehydrogenase [Thermoanaerobaculia bacterium]
METLESYVVGTWHRAPSGFRDLVDPSTGDAVARASSEGVDFAAVLEHARTRGGPALRELTFAQRAALLKEMSKALRERRDELLDLSRLNTGTTRPDGAFDVDGGTGTLAYYASVGKGLGDARMLPEDDGVQLARSEAFWGRHGLVPRPGVAVCINAFNFPVWGFAEKAACALLAGMPVVVKPATATALVAYRAVRTVIDAGILPEGALQLVCGGTGDLLDRLGPHDVLAFTGSAETAATLQDRTNLRRDNTRINVEADSLNAAVLAPGGAPGTDGAETAELFLRDVVREMTQKTGQKCTAVRRILVPAEAMDRIQEALVERLGEVVTGNPADDSVTMGPLATADQLDDTAAGVAELARSARIVHGSGERIDGAGSPSGQGYFFGPTLLRAGDAANAGPVHRREVFAPVATLMPYDGDPGRAAEVVALAEGTLVTSVYGDDPDWLGDFLERVGGCTGRVYVGSSESAAEAPGSGIALPQSLHGGPGRAGGGEELGGLVGVKRYMQRVAVQGARPMVDALLSGTSQPA